MAECCCPPNRHALSGVRGSDGGRRLATIKALLKPGVVGLLEMVTFRFCPEPACDTAYASDTGQVFRVDDLRVPVWQKLPPGDRILCYCFGETERDLQGEIEAATVDWDLRTRVAGLDHVAC